jgi:signal peptidase I
MSTTLVETRRFGYPYIMPTLTRLPYLFLAALTVVLPVRLWVAEPITIASASMTPEFRVGTLMILDKWTLRRRRPARGDVISFRSPLDGNEDMVKRVIAVPGETVEIRAKQVFVDGRALAEPYAVHDRPNARLDGDDLGPLTVPPDSYFVLGDNRDESNDSSVWKGPDGRRIYFLRGGAVQGYVRSLPWAS